MPNTVPPKQWDAVTDAVTDEVMVRVVEDPAAAVVAHTMTPATGAGGRVTWLGTVLVTRASVTDAVDMDIYRGSVPVKKQEAVLETTRR